MQEAIGIIKKLKAHGYEAYLVGGVVRDFILKIAPNDIDITTSATPQEVMELFKSFPSGLKFGSVTVLENHKNYEVTTFRLDFDYRDSRRPNKIKYATNVKDDVWRRDFTINALLMDENLQIIDLVNGLPDLESKTIRAVGVPTLRFEEDALRILRAIHFVSKLGFEIEKNTRDAIVKCSYKLVNLAGERILQEIIKIQHGKFFLKAIKTMKDLLITKTLNYLEKGVDYYLTYPNSNPDDFVIMAGALDNNLGRAIRLSRKETRIIEKLTDLIKNTPPVSPYLIYEYGIDLTRIYYSYLINTHKIQNNNSCLFDDVLSKTLFLSRDKLNITNSEIISIINQPVGPWVKMIEEKILIKVLNENFPNNKLQLKKLVKEIAKNELPK